MKKFAKMRIKRKRKKKVGREKKRRKKNSDELDEDEAFHCFISYIHIHLKFNWNNKLD